MSRLGWEGGGNGWRWRTRLLVWEEESVMECSALLNNVILQNNIQDSWKWLLDPIHGYSVRGTYRSPTSGDDLVAQITMFGINYFLLKLFFFLGVFFKKEFQQNQTW